MQIGLGFLLAIGVSYVAYSFGSLSKNGAVSAVFIGTIIYGSGGWKWAALILAFFIISSIFSNAFKESKKGLLGVYSKGGQRDAGQVFSNGGISVLFVFFHVAFPQALWPWLGFAGAIAAANADTWATEIGILDPNKPHLITAPSRQVAKGTSGGVTRMGTLAAILGSTVIGLLAMLLAEGYCWQIFVIICASGLLGALIDSVLGATVQAMYFCPAEGKETERHPLHTCGAETIHLRGWKWLNNDTVNLFCTASGALISVLLALSFGQV
jgi:uncharacterized protein (TIGR00297 family)